ncbi:MAG: 2-C-methyl-D-erythritol 4-phosphate cytidylyltransferase [Eubacteriales bacterium SKADARSKE-1]|nr:2-C-methyl-D-erythritol 4-phosphate cytidylyltransferase [Eubacteriales bacterium SKADARSKE-1]
MIENKYFTSAIIVAAGNSSRMRNDQSKIFEMILKKPSILYALKAFQESDFINEIIIVCKEKDIDNLKYIVRQNHISKFNSFALGGSSRQKSVFSGINKASSNSTHFAIHDAARICITKEIIDKTVRKAYETKAAITGVPLKDTVKYLDDNGLIINTPIRSKLWCAQTPQVFEKYLYIEAMKRSNKVRQDYTDDSQLIENCGGKVYIVMGDYKNIKITTPEDILICENMLLNR